MEKNYNSIVNITEKGLSVSSKNQIMEDLKTIARDAYSSAISIEPGTEFYTLLDLLSYQLKLAGDACKNIWDSFAFTTASGVSLDNLASLVGISRKKGEKGYITVRIENTTDTVQTLEPNTEFSIVNNSAYKNYTWINNVRVIINPKEVNYTNFYLKEESYAYTVEVKATFEEPIIFKRLGYDDGILLYQAQSDSIKGNELYTDTELRYLYSKQLYSKSVGTIEGIEAKLLEYTDPNYTNLSYIIKDSKILNNRGNDTLAVPLTATSDIVLNPHSIHGIIQLNSDIPTTENSANITNIIAGCYDILDKYRSLGCDITLINNKGITIAVPTDIHIAYILNYIDSKDTYLSDQISALNSETNKLCAEFINSLKLGQDIPYGALYNCISTAMTNLFKSNIKAYITGIEYGFVFRTILLEDKEKSTEDYTIYKAELGSNITYYIKVNGSNISYSTDTFNWKDIINYNFTDNIEGKSYKFSIDTNLTTLQYFTTQSLEIGKPISIQNAEFCRFIGSEIKIDTGISN